MHLIYIWTWEIILEIYFGEPTLNLGDLFFI